MDFVWQVSAERCHGGAMHGRFISQEDAAYLLDMDDTAGLEEAVSTGLIKVAKKGPRGNRFDLFDIVLLKLAATISGVGVSSDKALKYAEAVLEPRFPEDDKTALAWVENESQELYCLLVDGELARIYLKNKEDCKEINVGAVKPVLFPTIKTEINVFRVIRPVLYKAMNLLGI